MSEFHVLQARLKAEDARQRIAACVASGALSPTKAAKVQSYLAPRVAADLTLAKALPTTPLNEIVKGGMFKALPAAPYQTPASRAMAKAMLPVPDDGEHNRQANRPKQSTTQSDIAGVAWALRRTLARNVAEGKYQGHAAAKAEKRINDFVDATAHVTNANTSKAHRQAALTAGVNILRVMADEGSMDELEIAPLEGQLHCLGQTLGLGVAGDVRDPLVAE